MKCALVVLAACGSPPTGPVNVVAAPAAPTCIASKHLVAGESGGAPVGCYAVPEVTGDVECWRLDGRTWRFVKRTHIADEEAPGPVTVDMSAATATICKPDHTDCKDVRVSGITIEPEETLTATTNADRSLVAVRSPSSAVHVFDMTGKRLAKVGPWHTEMAADGDTAMFRQVHLLGNVLEVEIADTPISSAIRLYDARTGAQIADVYGGKPMNDSSPPGSLGGTSYAFLSIDHALVVVDIATGRQLASYSLAGDDVPMSFVGGTPSRISAIVGATGFAIEGGVVSRIPAPICPP